MGNVLITVTSVFGYILLGFIIKKTKIISSKAEKAFTAISFNFFLPLAIITNFWQITFPEVVILKLFISFFGAGLIVFFLSFFIGKYFYNFKIDDSALFGLGACFGNSVALGIPLMYSILGQVNAMPYMVLVLFHGIFHFTYTTLIIESYRNRKFSIIKLPLKTILGLLQNTVLAGMFIGVTLNYFNIPFPNLLQQILLPIAKIALPIVLVSMGLGLAGYKIVSDFSYSLTLTVLKNFVYPLIAFILAKYILSMPPLLIFIVTIAAALPSGTQTYYFSYRYNSLQEIISANVVISTFVSFFTLSLLLILFGY